MVIASQNAVGLAVLWPATGIGGGMSALFRPERHRPLCSGSAHLRETYENDATADVPIETSAVGRKAALAAAWPEPPLLAQTGYGRILRMQVIN